jgi:hypothetical protein
VAGKYAKLGASNGEIKRENLRGEHFATRCSSVPSESAFSDSGQFIPAGRCSEVKSQLGIHLLTPVTRLYTQHTNRHPGVASSSTMGEVTDVRVNKTYN